MGHGLRYNYIFLNYNFNKTTDKNHLMENVIDKLKFNFLIHLLKTKLCMYIVHIWREA